MLLEWTAQLDLLLKKLFVKRIGLVENTKLGFTHSDPSDTCALLGIVRTHAMRVHFHIIPPLPVL